jgi:hypothetical protein
MAQITKTGANEGSKGSGVTPEWIRPKQVKALFGIGNGLMQQLVKEGRVKTVSICQPGLSRGTRLISYAGLCAYLDGLASGQEPTASMQEGKGGAA